MSREPLFCPMRACRSGATQLVLGRGTEPRQSEPFCDRESSFSALWPVSDRASSRTGGLPSCPPVLPRGPIAKRRPSVGWTLHAVNCRTNHVHVVVSAQRKPEDIRDQFKAWCTRKLKESQRDRGGPRREDWWTERGSIRCPGDDESLAAVQYVTEGQ
jgi:hypothetical protein